MQVVLWLSDSHGRGGVDDAAFLWKIQGSMMCEIEAGKRSKGTQGRHPGDGRGKKKRNGPGFNSPGTRVRGDS